MKYFGATNRGRARENNEDSFHAEEGLFMVADGMGGHKAGEVASRMSVKYFLQEFRKMLGDKGVTSLRPSRKVLEAALAAANDMVYRESISNPDCSGMGTTFTACHIMPGEAGIIHVGDSRAYLIRNNDISLITSDHTFVGEMYRRGEITYEETFDHPRRNYLTNVLGMAEEINADYHDLKTAVGDRLILCTDGLNSMLRDRSILKVSGKNNDPEKAVKALIRQSNRSGGDDNITVIVVDLQGENSR